MQLGAGGAEGGVRLTLGGGQGAEGGVEWGSRIDWREGRMREGREGSSFLLLGRRREGRSFQPPGRRREGREGSSLQPLNSWMAER